MRKERRDY